MVRLAYVTTLLQCFTLCVSVESCSSLSGGAVAGIVILVLIVVALLVVVAVLLLRDRRYQIRAEVKTLRAVFGFLFSNFECQSTTPGSSSIKADGGPSGALVSVSVHPYAAPGSTAEA